MLRILLPGLFVLLSGFTYSQADQKLRENLEANRDAHEMLYRYFHRNPELSFEEVKTSAKLSNELEKLGYKVTRNVGGNGFVGLLENGEGPVIMLRTDLDALPLQEKTGLEYASEVPGVMHACGHDMHMTVWLGTAELLAAMKDDWQGTLMMIAQQAEERSGGANAMIDDGLFRRFPVPDYALAYHVSAELPAGTIGYRPGPFMAGVNSLDIKVRGIGGHGAMPHTAVDPIVLASRMVLAFQTIPSREISPLNPAVLTVGSIQGGTVHNIIPDEVEMKLTLRFFDDAVYADILDGINRICNGIAASSGLPEELYPEIQSPGHLTPPLINDDELVASAVSSFASILGRGSVIEVEPITVAEDFARYGRTKEQVPIAMFWLGTVNHEKFRLYEKEGKELPGLHNPEFHPDFGPTYTNGVLGMARVVLDLFNP